MTCCLLVLLAPLFSPAQKTAVVDLNKVIQSLPETKIAQDKLDSSVSFLQQIHKALVDSLQWVQNMCPYGPYNAEIKIRYLQKQAMAQDNLDKFEKEASEGLKQFRKKLYDPLLNTAKTLSIKVSKAYGYKALAITRKEVPVVLYAETEPSDITDIVVEEIKKHTKK